MKRLFENINENYSSVRENKNNLSHQTILIRYAYFPLQMAPYPATTAIGCTASLVTRLRVRVTGLAGTAQPPNSCASVDCCTTRTLTLAIGLKTSRVAKNTVSIL